MDKLKSANHRIMEEIKRIALLGFVLVLTFSAAYIGAKKGFQCEIYSSKLSTKKYYYTPYSKNPPNIKEGNKMCWQSVWYAEAAGYTHR